MRRNISVLKRSIFAGAMASWMLVSGMPVCAATISATPAVPDVVKNVKVAREITVPTSGDNEIAFTISQFDCNNGTSDIYENGDGTAQNMLSGGPWTVNVTELTALLSSEDGYEKTGNNQKGSASLSALGADSWGYGEYTLKIEETSPADKGDAKYGWTNDDTVYYLHVYVQNSDGGKVVSYLVTKSTEVTGDGASAAYGDKVSEIAFNNTYTKRAGSGEDGTDEATPSLTVRKQVDGDSAGFEPEGTTYDFTIKLKDSNTAVTKGQTYTYKIVNTDADGNILDVVPDENGNETRSVTVPDNRNVKISLQKNQMAVFDDIPAGIECKVEEDVKSLVNIEGYKNIVTTAGTTTTSQNNDKDTNAFPLSETSNDVVFVNTYKTVTATGIVTDNAPFIALVAISAVCISIYVVLMRRLRK